MPSTCPHGRGHLYINNISSKHERMLIEALETDIGSTSLRSEAQKASSWVSARGPPWVALLRIRWNHLRQLWPSRMLSLRCRGWHWLLMMFRRLGCKSLCRVLHRVRHLLGVATRTGWWIRCSWCMLTSANISARQAVSTLILFGWGACIFILACNNSISLCA